MNIVQRALKSLKRNGFKKVILIQFVKFSNWLNSIKKKKDLIKDSFELHAKLVDKIYGEGLDVAVGQISDKLLKTLSIEFCKDSCFYNENKKDNFQSLHPILKVDNHSKMILEALNENIVPGNLHVHDYTNSTLKLLHDELRQMFKIHIGSPFIFVNTRIWKTKPNSKKIGPNDWHTDGFVPGHRKIMIYLTPLNKDYGSFEWKEKNKRVRQLNNEKTGKAIFFRNSDIMHQGVPGQTYERISIEVTLMRSLVNGEQEWEGHFFGRHFKNLKQLEFVLNN